MPTNQSNSGFLSVGSVAGTVPVVILLTGMMFSSGGCKDQSHSDPTDVQDNQDDADKGKATEWGKAAQTLGLFCEWERSNKKDKYQMKTYLHVKALESLKPGESDEVLIDCATMKLDGNLPELSQLRETIKMFADIEETAHATNEIQGENIMPHSLPETGRGVFYSFLKPTSIRFLSDAKSRVSYLQVSKPISEAGRFCTVGDVEFRNLVGKPETYAIVRDCRVEADAKPE